MGVTTVTIALALAGALPPSGTIPAVATAPAATPLPAADDDAVIVQARPRSPADPFVAVNAQSFAVTQQVDAAFIGPVSLAYKTRVPGPVRDGVRNFLGNTREPVVFLSFLLQLKPGRAAETFGRFAINSTIGCAGLFDMAKRQPFHLPRRRNGFANTMAFYGVKPGPFLFLPLIGPTTVRDAIGGGLDRLVLPFAFGAPFTEFAYGATTGTLSGLDYRANFDDQLRALRDENADPYRARRELYLRTRQAEVDELRGRKSELAGPAAEPYRLVQLTPIPAASEAVAVSLAGIAPPEIEEMPTSTSFQRKLEYQQDVSTVPNTRDPSSRWGDEQGQA